MSVALIWLVQAVTGTLNVFRWELDDRAVAGAPVAVDFRALGAAVDRLDAAPRSSVSSVWTSGTAKGRFDIHYSIDSSDRVMRVDGQGRRLRDRSSDAAMGDGAGWDAVTRIHTSLMAGDTGKWLIGFSGLLLLTNIGLGLKLAWPKRGTIRKVLFRAPAGKPAARLYGWHRKVGLWFALPALFTISAGVLMVFSDGVERTLNAGLADPVLAAPVSLDRPIGFGAAVRTASQTFPGSSFSGASLPDQDTPWYRIRVRNFGELPRKWGTSVVYVAADDGRVLSAYDAARPHAGRAIVDTLYTLHTGQIGGTTGRVLVFLIGLTLLTLIGLGASLWWTRRRINAAGPPGRRRPAHFEAPSPNRG